MYELELQTSKQQTNEETEMRSQISKSEYYSLGGDDNELLAKVWTVNGWIYFRSFDGQ